MEEAFEIQFLQDDDDSDDDNGEKVSLPVLVSFL